MIVGVGVDVVEIRRARRLLERYGVRILARVCGDGEIAYIEASGNPAQAFAVRLAAKEAVFKALDGRGRAPAVAWRDIEVVRQESGKPTIALSGGAAVAAAQLGVARVHLSLSHSGLTAVACAVAEG